MLYNPPNLPTLESKPFWDAFKRRQLLLPRCNSCGRLHHYPVSLCLDCSYGDMEWVESSGKGKIYSYVIRHGPTRGFEGEEPGVIAVIELEDGLRMMGYLTGVQPDPEQIKVDMAVEIVFEPVYDQGTMFRFRPV